MSVSDRLANSFGLNAFDKRHKYALVVLAIAIIGVIVLWTMELRRSIVEPLYAQPEPKTAANNPAADNSADAAALRAKDTDGDTLNDYDELNLYKTSPYLADSDSDGFTDKQEIDSGNDPNCPTGQQCATPDATTPAGQSSSFSNPQLDSLLNAGVSGTVAPSVTPTAAPGTGLTAEQKAALRQQVGDTNNPTVIRQFLKQAGLPQATLDSLTDAQIVATFNEMIR